MTAAELLIFGKVGCNFNLGDKFPRFSVRVVSFRLILGYHRPPNGPDKGRILAARGIAVDGVWSIGTSTGMMTA
ncbi:hypothetical protein C1H46_021710 [Malus baccata]|uniref:Uncharacterized protein n=1 Tax=Malus baccata TaxID=106549 RepID=A0A540M1T7_MALBA|nr:hypothetical protein C1H46_021710 [Malus baccata]